ncbi:ABC transporter ATP-binding protein [Anaerobacillus isosaccharinicus]|uniref:Spermidine/putrescine ABC transporter ATP-binding protein n=2 Tax=Anaerobacillus isosaccharinicus TaxID=1532552 RepID=A0A1S2LBS1_9BACI|nr:ABC transporter ATP-binding protein [Anaerobacillus isosaccharinicus]
MSIVSIRNVDKTFFSEEAATTALQDISLSVANGEFVSLIGPSGCGKTTLLSLIAGLIQPTNGEINIEGQRILRPSPKTGYMLQQDYLFPWLTIEQNITIGLKTMKKLNEQTRSYALALLDKMGLLDKKDGYPSQLSGGMRQRVALVRMLATEPKLLLLDEPFSALDYQTKLKLEDLVALTIKDQKKTAILVTHDIGEAIAMSDRIVLLSARPGRIQNIFEVPTSLRSLIPFQARNHSDFNLLFQQIWKELESLEEERV